MSWSSFLEDSRPFTKPELEALLQQTTHHLELARIPLFLQKQDAYEDDTVLESILIQAKQWNDIERQIDPAADKGRVEKLARKVQEAKDSANESIKFGEMRVSEAFERVNMVKRELRWLAEN